MDEIYKTTCLLARFHIESPRKIGKFKNLNHKTMLGKLRKRKRLRTHGYLSRSAEVLNRRRAKGRKQLTVKIHSK